MHVDRFWGAPGTMHCCCSINCYVGVITITCTSQHLPYSYMRCVVNIMCPKYSRQELICMQITIWGGVFPIVVTWWAALGLTVYYLATNNVLFFVRSAQHMQVHPS